MDELKDILNDILIELQYMNSKMDIIIGSGVNNSLSDIYDKLEAIESTVDSLEI